MANTKPFLIVMLFAAILISSYEVSARELADPQSTRQTQSVEESKQYGNPGGSYGNPGGSYGNPGGGYGNPGGSYGGGGYSYPISPPSRQKMAKVVEEKLN